MTEPIKEIMKATVDMAKKKKKKGGDCGEGFQYMDPREIQELLGNVPEELTEDDLMEMSASEPMPEDEEEARKQIDIRQSGRRILIIQDSFDFFYNTDPYMALALKLRQVVEEGLVLYRNIFRKRKKQKNQTK